MQAFKDWNKMECFSLISAELYFDSCREVTMLTFKEGRRSDVASLLIEPLLMRKSKHMNLPTAGVMQYFNFTVLIKPVKTINSSKINSKHHHGAFEIDRTFHVRDVLEGDEKHMSAWTC